MPDGGREKLIDILEHTSSFIGILERHFNENKLLHKEITESMQAVFKQILEKSKDVADFDLLLHHRIQNLSECLVEIFSAVSERIQNNVQFSRQAMEEVNRLFQRLRTLIEYCIAFLRTNRLSFLKVLDQHHREYKNFCNTYTFDHNQRLANGTCIPAASVVYLDIIHAFRGISSEATALVRLVSGLHDRDWWSPGSRSVLWANT
jgi:phosphate:Na+ symporter